MKINSCGTQMSAIVTVAQHIRKLSVDSGKQYLALNRGINAVCNIDLTEVVKGIDFNTNSLQAYPAALGRNDLKEAINHVYFANRAGIENIIVTGGSTMGLDIAFQALAVDKILIPAYYWTTYDQIMTIRRIPNGVYRNYDQLTANVSELEGCAVVICDPGNPTGDKYDDQKLLELIEQLNRGGVVVILDSPYRRMFFDETDTFYQALMTMENVIVIESFSKCIGLSGQRIGFVYSANKEFVDEFSRRLVSATNGINAFSQILVQKLLATEEGIKAVNEFKRKTVTDIALNIKYMENHGLLAQRFYRQATPVGIFVVTNKSHGELLNHFIGSLPLSYFTRTDKEEAAKFSRLCVSVPHQTFKEFFDKMLCGEP